jgi:hypothetical protein
VGEREAVKLHEELEGNAEERRDEKQFQLAAGQAYAVDDRHGQQAGAGKQKAVEHHVLHAHLVHGNTAEEEAGAPQAACQCARAVSEP